MLVKVDTDESQSLRTVSSYIPEGYAALVCFPETAEDVGAILAGATREQTPVTVSGAGTGAVDGRVPAGGIVIATDELNQIKSIVRDGMGGRGVAEAGVILRDFQQEVESNDLLYPPDPTERSCFLGGTVATNASGARTFKYGPTRKYVERLKIALPTGDVIDLRRGGLHADEHGRIKIPLSPRKVVEAQLPSYQMPRV